MLEIEEKPKRKMFIKPTVEEVKEYLKEINCFSVNPEMFVAFYESKGWKVGKNHMKNWKAAVTTWKIKNESSRNLRGGIPL